MTSFRRSFASLSLVSTFLSLTVGAFCTPAVPLPHLVTLTYWRVNDGEEDFKPYITDFATEFPYVKVEVKTFSLDEYENQLISAWAKGEGPDLYSIPNQWLGKYVQFSTPMPASMTLTTISTSSTLGRKKTVAAHQVVQGLTEQQVKDRWVDVVAQDVVLNDEIYALPLATDSLVLYYNKDLLAQAGIAVPPQTWDEFVADVPKMTVINEKDEILRSGAALGTHNNVQRYFDIVSLLMMQNGATMTDGNSARFNSDSLARPGYFPGLTAVQFYTDFANPKKSVYAWTSLQPDSLEAFTNGQTAFFFGYWYHLDEIQKRAPSLNFGITSVPQIGPEQTINFGNYWVEAVAKSSKNSDLAWAFIRSMTTHPELYLESTAQPAALRTLVADQQADPVLAPWANAALTDRQWYHGRDFSRAQQIIADLMDAISLGQADPKDSVDIAAQQISQTLDINQ